MRFRTIIMVLKRTMEGKMDYRKIMSRLNAALNQVNASYAVIAKKYGLSYNALMVMYIIAEYETVTQKNICDILFLSKSTVHGILLELIKNKYVVLISGKNKKEKRIIFTNNGEEFFSAILKDTEIFEKKVLDFIGEKEALFFLEQSERAANYMLSKVNETINRDD